MKRKIIFSLGIAILVLFGASSAVFLYLYHNPDYVKALLAREISRYAKSSLTIGDLSYSLHPLKIRARGIVFSPLDKGSGFHLQIPDLIADMTLEGPFGHKTLILKSLKMTRFQLRLSKDISISNILPEAGDSSLFSKGLKIIVAFFFFKDVQFQGAELIDGLIALQLKDQEVQATGIHLKTETDRSLTVSGSITLTVPSQNMRFEAPDVHMKTDGAFSFGNPQLRCFLTAHEMTLYSPRANVKTMSAMTTVIYDFSHKKMILEPMEMHLHGLTLKHDPDRQTTFRNPEINVEGMDLKAKLTYEQDLKGLSFESMGLDLQGITLKQEPGKKSILLNMNLKASGILSLLDHRMGSSISNLSVDKVLRLNGNLNAEFGKRTAIGLEVKEFNLSPQRIRDFLPSKVRKALDPFQLEAPLSLHGHMAGIKGQQQWEWDCNLKIRVKESPYSFTFEELRLHGDMSGEIHASGKFPAG
ncbi:MAG: hypothetical protein KKA81_15945, partial [Bacteroidetes bacterium]|nr:hypothetical protein [Bacteroidota bacterium]